MVSLPMRVLAGRCSRQRENRLDACPSRISKERNECLGIIGSDRADFCVGELIECECGSYADDTRAVGFVNWVPVMRLHAGRRKGMTDFDFLPRMVTAFVFACLLLQNSRPTFAAFTTGNVEILLLIKYFPGKREIADD